MVTMIKGKKNRVEEKGKHRILNSFQY